MIQRVISHGQVDSTQARALAALESGTARDGDVHVATSQTAGRGRRGRSWHSPGLVGLYLSAIVLLPAETVAPGSWTAAGALALLDAVVPAGARRVRLKWPNDLITPEGAKLAGVLAEARGHDQGMSVVLGLGLNVGPTRFPEELRRERPVVDLHGLGGRGTPADLLPALLTSLGARLEQARGHAPGLSADFSAALALGEGPVRVQTPQGELLGTLAGLDLEGDLELLTAEGRSQRVPIEHVSAVEAQAG